jgi:tetratricopeptide (TPR) repeat protein
VLAKRAAKRLRFSSTPLNILEFDTMARKLSKIARRVSFIAFAGIASLGMRATHAQEPAKGTESPALIDNPFLSNQSQVKPQLQSSSHSQTVSEPQQASHRRTITYQNPFAAASKSPPVDTSLRPGPISRWRHPVLPSDEASAIKSALLSTPAGEPAHSTWDQLPPAEDLRNRAAARGKETDPTFYSRLTATQNAIQFTPKQLTQPTWLTEFDEAVSRESTAIQDAIQVDAAAFNSPLNATGYANQTAAFTPGSAVERAGQVTRAFELDPIDTSLAKADVSPSIVSNCVETPEGWLEQAQHAAKEANSPEELSAVVEFCDRGMRGGPDEKLTCSLRRLSAWAHNRRGELLADADRAEEALNDFQAAISLDPRCSLAIHNRAVTLAQQNQFAAALRDFNRVIELNPGLAVAYRNRAELLAALGRMNEAVSDYNQALESLPNDAQLYRDRAYAYQQLGEFSKSAIDFDRAIEIAPNDPDAITQRGNLAAEQGNYDEALADFQQALAKDPKWAEAHRSLAWLEATCPNPSFQNPQGAIAAAEQAAKLAPANDYLILDTLAAAHASIGHFDRASEIQQRALASAPPEIVPSLKQRLALYQHGQAFRNISAASDRATSEDAAAESEAPGDPIR